MMTVHCLLAAVLCVRQVVKVGTYVKNFGQLCVISSSFYDELQKRLTKLDGTLKTK